MIELKIKAVSPLMGTKFPLPAYATAGAAAMDLCACMEESVTLAPGGRLYFEVGIGQADAVLRIMRAQGFGDIQVVKDHNDIPRVVFGTLCGEVYSE